MKRVTIADIAAETGMSVYAVSRTLSGKSGVSDSSRAYISEIAERMGYSSKSQPEVKPRVIRLVIPSLDLGAGEHYMNVVSGAERQARKMGVSLEIVTTNRLEDIPSDECSGYILAGELETEDYTRIAMALSPLVALFYLPNGTQIDNIMFSDYEVGGQACQSLIDAGHTQLAVVRGCGTNFSSPSMQARADGFRLEAEKHSDVLVQSLSLDDLFAFKERMKTQRDTGTLPTAYFCVNDVYAERLIAVFNELKVRVPYDASVIGFGNYEVASTILPPLTTIQAPMKSMGELAVQQVASATDANLLSRSAIRTLLSTEVVERASVYFHDEH
ncbi:transcriptional regulator LacI family [Vibrio maritimus]|uniref:Transcriptional regulator LacI family n=1 Tax=Vibrio maritimus TaxID=990268 RepID=A0A090RWJ0_9VIBR|nr:transcriptional regulator LacI family [Vibrio maritimus]